MTQHLERNGGVLVRFALFVTLVSLGCCLSAPVGAQAGSVSEPRIKPLESAGALPPLNYFKVMANHPDLVAALGPYARYILFNNSMPARDREIVTLRTVFLCGAEMEWGAHSISAKDAGLTETEIKNVALGPDAKGWSSFDRALLRAADELHNNAAITDRTWAYLDARYDDKQLMDLVFTVGQYTMVSMAINAFRIPMDEGLQGFPKEEPKP